MNIKMKTVHGNKLAEQGKLDDWQRSAHPYTCTLMYNNKQMTIPFFMGSAHTSEPKKTDVIPCLLSDYSIVKSSRHFEDFCDNLGYDSDSRKAEKIYNDTKRQAEKFENMFGEEGIQQLEKLYEEHM
jgi:hypothetical protein